MNALWTALSADHDSDLVRLAFSVTKLEAPLGSYSKLAQRAVDIGDIETVLDIVKSPRTINMLKAAAIRTLPSLEGVTEIVTALLASNDAWAKVFILQKICQCPCEIFSEALCPLLKDDTEIDDMGVSYRIANLAAVAIHRQQSLPVQVKIDFLNWLDEQKPLLNSNLPKQRIGAILLFAELGCGESLDALRKLCMNDDDPFQELSANLVRIENTLVKKRPPSISCSQSS